MTKARNDRTLWNASRRHVSRDERDATEREPYYGSRSGTVMAVDELWPSIVAVTVA